MVSPKISNSDRVLRSCTLKVENKKTKYYYYTLNENLINERNKRKSVNESNHEMGGDGKIKSSAFSIINQRYLL